MKKTNLATFNAMERTRSAGSRGSGGAIVATGKKKAYTASNAAKKAGTFAGKVVNKVAKNPGKAGLALAGLAAAGGLGMAGAKAIGNARKPKSLTDRIKNASKKMFK